ncbi:hypothetical protein, partial [Cryobacterium algoritolerans]|uniref:hypothetical protein n=1 Tax=Cryobacterium algoritolerans TaxID=1259184 RepID=UPI003B97BC6D
MTVDLRLVGAAVAAWLASWLLTGAPGWAVGSQLVLWPAAAAALAVLVAARGARAQGVPARRVPARRVP